MAKLPFERELTTSTRESNVCSATVSGTAAVSLRFARTKMGTSKMDRRDRELVDKQMRRLTPQRNDGVIAVLLVAMFLIGMTLGGVLSEPKPEPIQIASTE